MKKKLFEGLKVIDITNNFAGPQTGAFLCDYGAEVIHVEKPIIGDDNRFFAPLVDGVSTSHMMTNRGKKSVVVNLMDPRGVEMVKKMIAEADILIESYRPGVMKMMGLDYETVKEINPKIIYCSVSAYGQEGPYATRPGYDVIAQAVSGCMDLTGEPDGPPTKIGSAIGDWIGALTAFGMINAALYYRETTGIGQHVDISLARCLVWMFARFDFIRGAGVPKRSGNHHQTLAPYGVYSGKNGQSIIIGALSQNLWNLLCDVIGRPELKEDPKFITNNVRCENLPELIEIIETWLQQFDDIREAEKLIMDAGVPCAKIYDMMDVFHDPHYNECEWIKWVDTPSNVKSMDQTVIPTDPFKLSEVEPEYTPAPMLGEHNHEILEALGYSAEEIDAIQAEWATRK